MSKESNNQSDKQQKPPKVWGKGLLRLGDFTSEVGIDCYILEDGTPILNKNKMLKAIGKQQNGVSRSGNPNFIGALNLEPFVRPELKELLNGVEFYDGNRLVSGYHADALVGVCNAYLEAREAGALTKSQLPIAQMCEILIRSFAKIGLRALIYEQLGFEKMKNPAAFRLLIESYLSEEIRKWSKEFPDELFFQMDRIYGNERTTYKNRPQYYAKFINKYVYKPLEKGEVLKRLRERNPKNEKGNRKYKHHSLASEEIGLPAIRAQIWQVVGVLKTSPSKRRFEDSYQRLLGQSIQTDMFPDE